MSRTFRVDPLCVQVREGRLVTQLLYRLLRLLVDLQDTTGPPSPGRLPLVHVQICISRSRRGVRADAVRHGAGKYYRRSQFGGGGRILVKLCVGHRGQSDHQSLAPGRDFATAGKR